MWRQTQKVCAFLQICIQFQKQYFQTRLFSGFLHSWFESGVKKLAYSQINHLLSYMWTCNSEIMIEELNKCQLYGSHIKILTIFFYFSDFYFHTWVDNLFFFILTLISGHSKTKLFKESCREIWQIDWFAAKK